jgi:uncharacterized protein YjbI with pentapeptide repeats
MDVCGQPAGSYRANHPWVTADRLIWCDAHGKLAPDACIARFADLEARFDAAWDEERDSTRADLPALDLSGRDLRRAVAVRVTLIGANLKGARMEGADLREARLEGANLAWTGLERTILCGARLEGADLTGARLDDADLRWTNLERAVLSDEQLKAAKLESESSAPFEASPDLEAGLDCLLHSPLDDLGPLLLPLPF